MGNHPAFANLQIFCDKDRKVAKRVYESLYKGYQTPDTTTLWQQFGGMAKKFGCTDNLNDDAKSSINKLFNMVASPSYFLRKYDDGWTSVLHERFCASNIASYALQYSQYTRDHLVVAFGYDDEQFICAALQDGKTVFHYNARRERGIHTIPRADEVSTFAKMIGCKQEDVLQMIDADYHEKTASASRIFKHPIIESAKKIKSAEQSLYLEVSGEGLWF